MAVKNKELIILYAEMAGLTKPECANTCRVPLSCCSPEYCMMTEMYSKEDWGVDLSDKHTGHPTLPFMGPTGCVIEPHLRPICTLHTCDINSIGCKQGDMAWTERYFALRGKIDELEVPDE